MEQFIFIGCQVSRGGVVRNRTFLFPGEGNRTPSEDVPGGWLQYIGIHPCIYTLRINKLTYDVPVSFTSILDPFVNLSSSRMKLASKSFKYEKNQIS